MLHILSWKERVYATSMLRSLVVLSVIISSLVSSIHLLKNHVMFLSIVVGHEFEAGTFGSFWRVALKIWRMFFCSSLFPFFPFSQGIIRRIISFSCLQVDFVISTVTSIMLAAQIQGTDQPVCMQLWLAESFFFSLFRFFLIIDRITIHRMGETYRQPTLLYPV